MEEKLRYFRIAKELNDKYAHSLQENDLHCRGNLNSISLISVNKDTPERGFSSIKDESTY